MALELNQPDYVSNALSAFSQGREMGKQIGIQHALQQYGSDPVAAQHALLKLGDLQGASQMGQINTQMIHQNALQQASEAAQKGDYAGAAGAAAGAGDPEVAGQYAQIPEQMWQAHAPMISSMVAVGQQLKQAVPSNPNTPPEVTAAQRQQYLVQHRQQLNTMGITDDQIDHPQLDLSDQGIDGFTQLAIAKGAYKPPYMTVPYGSSVINTATGQPVVSGHKFHATTLRREDGTTMPAVIDEATGAGFPVGMDGQPVTSQPLDLGQWRPMDGSSVPAPSGAQGAGQDTLAQRNNNPGNLRADGSKWQGMTGTDPQGFVQFDTPENGQRAAGINLANQTKVHGITTLPALIAKYAPASDHNDVQGYVARVAQQTGLDPNGQYNFADPAVQAKVLPAMFAVEGGGTPSPAQPGAAQAAPAAPGGQSLGDAMSPAMSSADKALVASRADALALGQQFTSRNPRDQYLTRQAQELALQKYGPDALNPAHAAMFDANKQVLDKAAKDRETIAANIQPAEAAADLTLKIAQDNNLTGKYPVFNGPWRDFKNKTLGDPGMASFVEAMGTWQNEFNKVAAGSNGTITDKSRGEISDRFNKAQNMQQLMAVVQTSKQLMAQVLDSRNAQIDQRVYAVAHGLSPDSTDTGAPQGQQSQGFPHIPGSTAAQMQTYTSHFKPGSAYGSAENPLILADPSHYANIPHGAHFVDPDGNIRQKP